MEELKQIKGMEFTQQGGWNVLTTDGEYKEFSEKPRPSYRDNGNQHPQVDLAGNMIVFGSEQAATVLKEMVGYAKKETLKQAGTVVIPGPRVTVVGPTTVRQIPITVINDKTDHPFTQLTRPPRSHPCVGEGCHSAAH